MFALRYIIISETNTHSFIHNLKSLAKLFNDNKHPKHNKALLSITNWEGRMRYSVLRPKVGLGFDLVIVSIGLLIYEYMGRGP
jgi:hypothetical protein